MHKNQLGKLCVLLICLFVFFNGCMRRSVLQNSEYLVLEDKITTVEKSTSREIEQIQRELSLQKEGLAKLKEVKAQPLPPPAPVSKKTMEEFYPKGLSLYFKKDYVMAADIFQDLVRNYPHHKLTPNALYWLGECYYDQKHYTQAITEFQRVLADFPESSKAPAAQLKIAYAYSMLKQGNTAMTYLQSLLKKYPKSREARMVRQGKTIFKP
ncbi:MAG: tol-pal system protein YbgF [Deltaproteobacteria bacterium]|nr:tol-pal system protein YbgF [Deltaproteobacteria bacterium]MBW2052596.1 tol-pal system protein YbgF [Deltaproteobacteria bacterium]MBW2141236.1 tol-pal system protein YbgF [Deltaproteobacteria bacterium]MBW2323620.1 tol-pal system protein YbgF [Deltaproteobacteria bacterium]